MIGRCIQRQKIVYATIAMLLMLHTCIRLLRSNIIFTNPWAPREVPKEIGLLSQKWQCVFGLMRRAASSNVSGPRNVASPAKWMAHRLE